MMFHVLVLLLKCNVYQIYLSQQYSTSHRMSGDFMSVVQSLYQSVSSEKCHMNMGPVLNGYGAMYISFCTSSFNVWLLASSALGSIECEQFVRLISACYLITECNCEHGIYIFK
jgi:hypothetical protein